MGNTIFKTMTHTISILGAGWLGEPLAQHLQHLGHQVHVSTRSVDKAARLSGQGLNACVLEVGTQALTGDVAEFLACDILIVTLPPGGRRNPAAARQYPFRIRTVLAAAKAQGVQQLIFTSSTGVYGDQQGWMLEDSELHPNTASGEALVEVEHDIRGVYGDNATILRLAGLYGPDRHPGRWFAGKRDLAGGAQRVNMVHQQDVIGVINSIIDQQAWGYTFNVCADEHPCRRDFYQTAAYDLGLVEPTFDPAKDGEEGKLVDNRLAKQVLSYQYHYAHPMQTF